LDGELVYQRHPTVLL